MRSHRNTPFKLHEFAFVLHGTCWCILAHWHLRMRICEQMKLSIYKMAKCKSVPRYFFRDFASVCFLVHDNDVNNKVYVLHT